MQKLRKVLRQGHRADFKLEENRLAIIYLKRPSARHEQFYDLHQKLLRRSHLILAICNTNIGADMEPDSFRQLDAKRAASPYRVICDQD